MKRITVVGAIIIEDGKILCAQRGNEKALPNLWEFPGGKIETGETAIEALERELKEELKIEVTVHPEMFEETAYLYDFGEVVLTTFICYLEKGEPVLTEHHQVKWVTPEDLDQLTWAPADIPAVHKLMEKGVKV
ncbi:MAG: (deoxy)nucleoside triphosphate pyrophosphohydrolase [Alkalibacterium sp.]|nr:(deoxy)nucleoside triphosphate pyrophosphohydrolase [Alkalibacterium sp.]TVP89889.1 MAG: (deoxy)nucleoside triphosphate pyrophosphohydrolase [Alkalibacterium sp.]